MLLHQKRVGLPTLPTNKEAVSHIAEPLVRRQSPHSRWHAVLSELLAPTPSNAQCGHPDQVAVLKNTFTFMAFALPQS